MPTSAGEPLLEIRVLPSGSGKIGVLENFDFTVNADEVVALPGPSGQPSNARRG